MPHNNKINSESPCIGVCDANPEEHICSGCFRTLDEIAEWSRLTDHEKNRVNLRLDKLKRKKA
jgi:predicted Fe-S protein YdhL (DUF1289 family)